MNRARGFKAMLRGVLLLSALALLLAGCGGSNGPSATGSQTSSAQVNNAQGENTQGKGGVSPMPSNGSSKQGGIDAEFNAGQNRVTSAPPGADIAKYYPQQWLQYQANPEHDSAFTVPADAPKDIKDGVQWKFAGHNALPLDGPAYQDNPVNTTQRIGFATGVSVANGMVFGGQSARRVYAVNAVTGKEVWAFSAINEIMNTPVVADGLVFAGAGDTGFDFSKLLAFKDGKPVSRGLGFSGYYALDAKTGKQVWRYDTKGEAMPGALYKDGTLYFGTGDGNVYALDGKTGKEKWKTNIGGFVSMSSTNALGNLLYVGSSAPNFVYALDINTGQIVWKQTIPGIANTGMGDNSPAVDPKSGLVIQNSVVDSNSQDKTIDVAAFAMDAKTGQIKWQTKLGRGPTPPAFKAGVPMVQGDRVYMGSPATSKLYALSLSDGHILWTLDIPHAGKAGAGRGSPTYYQGKLYLAAGSNVFKINPDNGKIEGQAQLGGRFGIVNPVIVGGTMYLANSWGWILAVPLTSIK